MAQAIQRRVDPALATGSSGKSLVRRIFPLIPQRLGTLASLGVAVGLAGLGHGALALSAGLLGKALIQPGGTFARGSSLREITYFGLGAACVKATGSILLAFSETKAAGSVVGELRRRVLSRLAQDGLPDSRLRILAIVAVRCRELELAVVQGAIAGVRAMAQLAPILLALIFVSPQLALVGSAVLAPFALGVAAVRRRWQKTTERAQRLAEDLHTGVDELLENLDLWRTYGATARIERSIENANAQAVQASARADALRAAISGGNEVLGALAVVIAIALGGRVGFGLGAGTLVAFTAMCFMAYRPLRDLSDARAWSARGIVALDALDAVMRTEMVREIEPVRAEPDRFAAARLVAVDLGARERGPLSSFVLEPGVLLLLVGPTGSGKTTLLRVLLGLEPAKGELRYGDADLRDARVGPSARPFAWVPQEAPLVTGTILENVALACGDESRARRALAELGAMRLLGRAGERVGPGARPLSGGERRLVSMARALATGLPVLLLDEPTEGLDADARALVIDALRRLKGRRSLVIASHESDLLAVADRVLTLGDRDVAGIAAE